jgi:methionyl aminopeptidase
VNSQVVHGIPSQYALEEGDIISVDCGVKLNGYFGDSAYTFAVGETGKDVEKLMRITKESLFLGLWQAREGNRIGDIGHAVQKHAEDNGYSVVREMVGHGLGTALHEEPEVPNYGKRGTGLKLKQGMCMCVEPMINMGEKFIRQGQDGWTITTRDNQPSAHFEMAIAVTRDDPDVLSTFDYIEEALHI